MAEITFYTNPRSRGRMIRWMLEDVGAEHSAGPQRWMTQFWPTAEFRIAPD